MFWYSVTQRSSAPRNFDFENAYNSHFEMGALFEKLKDILKTINTIWNIYKALFDDHNWNESTAINRLQQT